MLGPYPNITGRTVCDAFGPLRRFKGEGAIYPSVHVTQGLVGESIASGMELVFSAAKSQSVYKESSTVQPAALYALIIIKV